MSPVSVIGIYADHRAIKETFKNTKQLIGGRQPHTFKSQGPERTLGLSLWRYSVVVVVPIVKEQETHPHGYPVNPTKAMYFTHSKSPINADLLA